MMEASTCCPVHREHLQDLLTGALPDEEAIRLEDELARCLACRRSADTTPAPTDVLMGVTAAVASFRKPRTSVETSLLPLAATSLVVIAAGLFWVTGGAGGPSVSDVDQVVELSADRVTTRETKPLEDVRPSVVEPEASYIRSVSEPLFADGMEDGDLSAWGVQSRVEESARMQGAPVRS